MTITIAVIFGLYLLCNLPQTIYVFAKYAAYGDKPPFPFWILVTDKIMAVVFRIQVFSNPIVYPIKDKLMRRAYQKMFFKNNNNLNQQ